MSKIEEYRRRWAAAAHAMQSGVAIEMEEPVTGQSQSTDPKHLRVGINVALRDQGSIVQLLISKGLITEEEYFKAIAEGMEAEAKEYEQRLTKRLGVKVSLG
jgi:hypothetical protein